MSSVSGLRTATRVVLSVPAVLILGRLAFGCSDTSGSRGALPAMSGSVPAASDSSAGPGGLAPASTPAQSATGPAQPAASPASPPTAASDVIAEPTDKGAFIYDPAQLRTYDLTLTPENLAILDADPRAEQYVEGSLTLDGETQAPVGIRYKGSAGAFVFSGCIDSEGAKACTKLSMKVGFDFRDPEARFHGLRKLQFHAMYLDPSMLKERLAYAVFRQFGVAAPRAVHARLRVNGQFIGVFTLVEQIDGRFTRSRFAEGGEGNLYKEAWPLTSDRVAVAQDTLVSHLETNEDENPVFTGMLAFADELQRADSSALPGVLQRFTDLEYSLRYVAVDRTIAVDDGPFHWYCGGGCWNHNYFWYEEPGRSRLWLIPWDLDSSFNLDNPTTTIWLPWDDTSQDCSARDQPPFTTPLRLPACDKLTLGWASMQARYLELVSQLLGGPLSSAVVETELSQWTQQLAPSVAEAASVHTDAVSVEAWHEGVTQLRAAIESLRQRGQARLAEGARAIQDPWLLDAGMPDAGPLDAGVPALDADAGE
jgi:hypothetical protein